MFEIRYEKYKDKGQIKISKAVQ